MSGKPASSTFFNPPPPPQAITQCCGYFLMHFWTSKKSEKKWCLFYPQIEILSLIFSYTFIYPQSVTILPSKYHFCASLQLQFLHIPLFTHFFKSSKKVAFPQLRVFTEWIYPGSVASPSHNLPRWTYFHKITVLHYYAFSFHQTSFKPFLNNANFLNV